MSIKLDNAKNVQVRIKITLLSTNSTLTVYGEHFCAQISNFEAHDENSLETMIGDLCDQILKYRVGHLSKQMAD